MGNGRAARRRARRRRTVGRYALTALALICVAGLFWIMRQGVRPAGDRAATAMAAIVAPTEMQISERTFAPAAALEIPTLAPAATPLSKTDGFVSVVVSAAGDFTLGGDGGGAKRFHGYYAENGADYFLQNVRDIFAEDDFTIINLEGPLTTATKKRSGRQFNFRGLPEYASILAGASIEVAGLANNHALDYLKAGLVETAEVVEAAGIGVSGYDRAFYAEKDGVRLCFLSYTQWDESAQKLAERVRAEREQCDLLIVSIHWGRELVAKATSEQKAYGRALVDAGADLVLGSHPHVVGGIERYKGKYIVYSLGNFCFGGNSNPKDKRTMIFRQAFVFGEEGLQDGGIDIIPCSISSSFSTNNYQPTPLTGDKALDVLREVASHTPTASSEILWIPGGFVDAALPGER